MENLQTCLVVLLPQYILCASLHLIIYRRIILPFALISALTPHHRAVLPKKAVQSYKKFSTLHYIYQQQIEEVQIFNKQLR